MSLKTEDRKETDNMKKECKKEIENEMFLYENFLRRDYCIIAAREKKKYFEEKYDDPKYEIVQKSNKHGIRIIVIEKRAL